MSNRRHRRDGRYLYLRQILSDEYANLSDSRLEDALEPMLGDISLEDYEINLRDLSRVARKTGDVLGRAAPGALSGAAQGATMGAALGPYGALVGGIAGAFGGGLQSYQASQQPRATPQRPVVPPQQVQSPAITPPSRLSSPIQTTPRISSPNQGGSASSQLLAVLSRPEVLQALLSMAMAQTGRRNIQVGSTQVPVAAFSNLISTLAQRTAGQQNTVIAREANDTPSYLLNESGEFICDPMDSEQRADVLLNLLNQEERRNVAHERHVDWQEDQLHDDHDYYDEVEDEVWEEELDELFGYQE